MESAPVWWHLHKAQLEERVCVYFFYLVCLCCYVSPRPRPYTTYFIHPMARHRCAESAVKHQTYKLLSSLLIIRLHWVTTLPVHYLIHWRLGNMQLVVLSLECCVSRCGICDISAALFCCEFCKTVEQRASAVIYYGAPTSSRFLKVENFGGRGGGIQCRESTWKETWSLNVPEFRTSVVSSPEIKIYLRMKIGVDSAMATSNFAAALAEEPDKHHVLPRYLLVWLLKWKCNNHFNKM